MKKTLFACCALCALGIFAAAPVKIIFDTDFYGDYDDVGAAAMLHAYADAGQAEILACGTCTWGKGNRSVAALEIVNAYYGRPDIPVGGTDHGGLRGPGRQGWGLIKKYPQWVKHLDGSKAPKAVDVYLDALRKAPDGSVTVVSVGFLNNIADLLRADRDLVAKKVKLYVAMACAYPKGKECNSMHDAAASAYVFDNWPTPIIFTDWQLGCYLYSGRRVSELPPEGANPIRDAFKYMLTPRDRVVPLGTPGKRATCDQPAGHPSWDETAVLIAVEGWEKWFNLERGTFKMVGAKGDDVWIPDPKSANGRVTEKVPRQEVGLHFDELMCRPPARK